jgi:uncharacterized membrane protein YraQ (UPF0718 family)
MIMSLLYELNKIFYLTVFQFKQIFPYWISGVFAGSLLSVYVLPSIGRLMEKIKGCRYNIFAAITAAVLGVVSPICMFGTIPLITSLGKKEVPQYLLATFMICSILLNPNLLLLSFALGTPLALLRLFSCIAAGLLAGIMVRLFYNGKQLFRFPEAAVSQFSCTRKKTLLKDINKSITITAPYFLVGILITALFDLYFPKTLILQLFGQNKGVGVLLAASLGVPVYVCGGGTIPLLRLWLQRGMSPGSAIAFMITGPATKLTNLSALKIILGARNFAIYIAYNLAFGIAVGLLTDAFHVLL